MSQQPPRNRGQVPQEDLQRFLERIAHPNLRLDASVMPTRFADMKLVQTTDFFYPLIEDPYMQGRIACANVLSDLYAMGVTHCDNMLMLLGVSRDVPPEESEIAASMMMQGFADLALEAGTAVTGGQTVKNPWYIIGGVATAVAKADEILMPTNAVPGDVLVLTKPLGTQVAVNAHQWLISDPERWQRISDLVTPEQVEATYTTAMLSMARLNKRAAELMHKHNAHAATDVTGFGLLGHARNLASNQVLPVAFAIDTLPVFSHVAAVNSRVNFRLTAGFSSETSGGLLIAMSAADAENYIHDLQSVDNNWPAFIIGRVLERDENVDKDDSRLAWIADDASIIEVSQRSFGPRI